MHTLLLGVRSLAKNLTNVPGRKSVVLFTSGFPLSPEAQAELTATISACNQANVAIYPLDVRGLIATAPSGLPSTQLWRDDGSRIGAPAASQPAQHAHLVLAAYPIPAVANRPIRSTAEVAAVVATEAVEVAAERAEAVAPAAELEEVPAAAVGAVAQAAPEARAVLAVEDAAVAAPCPAQ